MELTDEELELVVGGSVGYASILNAWKRYVNELRMVMPSGTPSSGCPQDSVQIGFLGVPDGEGNPSPRCVRDGSTINSENKVEEDFQDSVKKNHKRMKIRLLKTGGNKTKAAPYNQDPSMDRSKSAPPGFGGS
jgi:hypothetical protein